jgi:hypothetical protein
MLAPTTNAREQTTTQRSNTGTQTTPHKQQKRQHPNIPTRPYTYRILRLLPVEDDQENKTGQEIFCTS